MFIYTTHTASTAESKQSFLLKAFPTTYFQMFFTPSCKVRLRSPEHCRRTSRSLEYVISPTSRRGFASPQCDCIYRAVSPSFVRMNSADFHLLLTKDLPCGIPANALPGRRDVFNINLNFICYEKVK